MTDTYRSTPAFSREPATAAPIKSSLAPRDYSRALARRFIEASNNAHGGKKHDAGAVEFWRGAVSFAILEHGEEHAITQTLTQQFILMVCVRGYDAILDLAK